MLGWLFEPPGIPVVQDVIRFYQWTARLEGVLIGIPIGVIFTLALVLVFALLARK